MVDELTRIAQRHRALAGRLDLGKIGIVGHSYGARSVLAAAGERLGPGHRLSFKEPRIRAGVALSPVLPRNSGDFTSAYREIDIPLFHITGTRDASVFGRFVPGRRLIPYRHLTISDQYLLVLDKADHQTFSGRRTSSRREQRHLKSVRAGMLLFLNAYLAGDRSARDALRQIFAGQLARKDRFEFK